MQLEEMEAQMTQQQMYNMQHQNPELEGVDPEVLEAAQKMGLNYDEIAALQQYNQEQQQYEEDGQEDHQQDSEDQNLAEMLNQ